MATTKTRTEFIEFLSLDLDDVGETSGKKVMTQAERTKLSTLEGRANHTGTQPLSTVDRLISGLLDDRARPGEVPDAFAATFAGEAEAKTAVSGDATSVVTGLGRCLVLPAAGVVACRGAIGIGSDVIEIDAAVKRTTASTDPSGDAIVLAVAWLNDSKALISTSVLATAADLSVADGVRLLTGRIAAADLSGTTQAPAGAAYAVGYVQTYGADGATAVAVLRQRAVTEIDALEREVDAIQLAGATGYPVYASTAAGLAATSNGEGFSVVTGTALMLYRNDAGSATQVASLPLSSEVAALSSALDAESATREEENQLLDGRLDTLEGQTLGPRVTSLEGALTAGVERRAMVRAAATGNVALTGATSPIDGAALVNGDRYLAPAQSAPAQNGIYVYNSAGAHSRAGDMDEAADVAGSLVYVQAGTVNGGRFFYTPSVVTTLGTDAIVWQLDQDQGALQDQIDELEGFADPVMQSAQKLRRPGGWLVTNTTNRLILQANGAYTSNAATWAAEWDFEVTGGAAFFVDWPDVAGVTITVQERDASEETVAPVTIGKTGDRRQAKITANASTTIARVKLSGPSSGTTVAAPSVTLGRAATVPTDPDYLSLIMDRIEAVDGASLAAGIAASSASSGSITSVVGQTISVATGTLFTADYAMSNVTSADFVALLEIGTTFTPRSCSITPLLIGGGTGTAIDAMAYRWGDDNSRFLVRVPHEVGGVKVIGLRLGAHTSAGGGPNIGTAGAATFTLKPYSTNHLPALRTLPTAYAETVADQIDAAIAEAAAATTREIARAAAHHLGDDEAARMITARIHASAVATAHVSAGGDDSNTGDPWAPKLTSETATAASSTGRGVLHKRGETHVRLGQASGSFAVTGQEIGAYGSGRDRAILDSRVLLSGLTWTADGSGWTADVTLTQTTGMNGPTNSDTTHFYLSDCRESEIGTKLDWEVGGASIAANKTEVDSNGNAFTIWRTGSTTQDPRSDSNSTTYTLYLNIGADPNGLDLRLSQRSGPIQIVGGALRDVILIGGSGKDANQTLTSSGVIPELENTAMLLGSAHAVVGPSNLRGVTQFQVGAPTPASVETANSVLNRSYGGALNQFTGVDLSVLTLEHSGITYAGDASNAVYFHTSGNPGYKGWKHFGVLRAFNSTVAVKYDGGAVGTDGVLINRLESGPTILPTPKEKKEGCDFALDAADVGAGAEVVVRSGFHTTGPLTRANSGGLAQASRTATIRIGQWGGFEYTPRFNIAAASVTTIDGVVFDNFSTNYLAANTANIAGQRPVLHLYGLKDNSPSGKKAYLARFNNGGGDATYLLDLHLHSATLDEEGQTLADPIPCVCGDIADNAAAIPNRLFVDAGQTFGLFNRTRAAIRSAMVSAGRTAETDFVIDDETWIVNRVGAIIDVPESLGGTA